MQEEYTAKCQMEAEPETVGKLFGISSLKDDYTISFLARMTNDDIWSKYGVDGRDIAIDVPPRLTIKAKNSININYTGKIVSGPDSEIKSGRIIDSCKTAYFLDGGTPTPIGRFYGSLLDITSDKIVEVDCNMRRQRTIEFLPLGSRISVTFKDGTTLSGDRDSFTSDYVSDNGGRVINLDEILKRDGKGWKLKKKVKNFFVFDEDQVHGITIRYSIVYE
ncbi:MAG: hypothetical protein [Caudoviricetes sp.]|nr:MAG: hypothetical protein [Caudoviricetes sp.]